VTHTPEETARKEQIFEDLKAAEIKAGIRDLIEDYKELTKGEQT